MTTIQRSAGMIESMGTKKPENANNQTSQIMVTLMRYEGFLTYAPRAGGGERSGLG